MFNPHVLTSMTLQTSNKLGCVITYHRKIWYIITYPWQCLFGCCLCVCWTTTILHHIISSQITVVKFTIQGDVVTQNPMKFWKININSNMLSIILKFDWLLSALLPNCLLVCYCCEKSSVCNYKKTNGLPTSWTLFHCCNMISRLFNTLRPRQDGRHFPDDIFKCIFLNENV